MKNSNPNHSKAPFMVYYPPYVGLVPKTVGGVTLKLLGSPWYPFKLPIWIHENCSMFGGWNEALRP